LFSKKQERFAKPFQLHRKFFEDGTLLQNLGLGIKIRKFVDFSCFFQFSHIISNEKKMKKNLLENKNMSKKFFNLIFCLFLLILSDSSFPSENLLD
jgi:hypothetical protein